MTHDANFGFLTMTVPSDLETALSDRYEIERPIGVGGMATVYRARDLKHDRRVALKVLKPELRAVLGVDRFLTEIRLAARLQHPNLLPLFDSGEVNGSPYYVMPFVEGESLRAKLEREKQLAVDDALHIATAVASALEYAHGEGVIHRDLKPENILLHAGEPVVADFGIALAISHAGGARITQTGLSLGTPQYMSPEQATGDRDVDRRTDIFALGAVLYEMLTGEPPHAGPTAQAVIARVLTDRPQNVRALRPSVPEQVAIAIERALEKVPADRWASTREFADALRGKLPPPRDTQSAPAGRRSSRLRDPVVLAFAALAVGGLAAAIALASRESSIPVPAYRFTIAAPAGVQAASYGSWGVTLSPDGKFVVFTGVRPTGEWQLYGRSVSDLAARPIGGTEHAVEPVFSPDGHWLAFMADGKLKKISLDGGAAITLADRRFNNGLEWTPNDVIVLGSEPPRRGLTRIAAAGGSVTTLTRVDSARGESDHRWPLVLDDGETIAFTIWYKAGGPGRLALTSLRDGVVHALDVRGNVPIGLVGGRLLFIDGDGVIHAVPLDRARRKTTGDPVPVLQNVGVCRTCFGDAMARMSRSGSLVYLENNTRTRLTWIDPSGNKTAVSMEPREFFQPRLSPDETRIAASVETNWKYDVWVYDIPGGTFSRLGPGVAAEWTADGRGVIAQSGSSTNVSYVRYAADGSGARDTLIELSRWFATLSPDASRFVYQDSVENTIDLWTAPVGRRDHAERWAAMDGVERGPRWSPDGRYIAYVSDESGNDEVYVRAYKGTGSRVQISRGGGNAPVWSRDGNRVYWVSDTGLVASFMASDLSLGPSIRVSARGRLFDAPHHQAPGYIADYDVGRGRFLVLEPERPEPQIIVVANWGNELRTDRTKVRLGR